MPITFPNGQVFTTSAQTKDAVQIVVQEATLNLLGFDPTQDDTVYSKVRVGYQKDGQPDWSIDEDVCFITAMEEEIEYGRVRDITRVNSDITHLLETTGYTRGWRINFTFYGPSAYENATMVRSGQLFDFIHDLFAALNMYLVPDMDNPKRVPELFNGQWWERADFSCIYYEGVEDSLTTPTVASVEFNIISDDIRATTRTFMTTQNAVALPASPSKVQATKVQSINSSQNIGQLNAQKTLILASGGANGIAIGLPDPTQYLGYELVIKKVDATFGAVTLNGNIDAGTQYALGNLGQRVGFMSDGTVWQIEEAN